MQSHRSRQHVDYCLPEDRGFARWCRVYRRWCDYCCVFGRVGRHGFHGPPHLWPEVQKGTPNVAGREQGQCFERECISLSKLCVYVY
jgi:hypothetical protein